MDESGMASGLETPTQRPDWAISAPAARRLVLPAGVAVVTIAAAAFLLHQLMAWPPHEDETLALFIGRDSLADVLDQVTTERGGAPLHFLLAWGIAHAGLGLGALRLLSAAFAVASLPLVALLALRLAGRRAALLAPVLAGASWIFLFHGVYGRMYSLFLFLSLLSYLALLRALERGGRSWAGWCAAALATVAAHPYGALVLASQAAFVLAARRDRLRHAALAGAVVAVLGIPFWLTDLVLAGRFEVGVGAGGAKLNGPVALAEYAWRTAGDFSSGWWPLLLAVLALAAVGLTAVEREARALSVCVVAVPVAALGAAELGGSASPESRHLIFVLPFFAVLVAAGILRATRRLPVLAAVLAVGFVVAELAWAWQRTPPLFEWEPDARQAARTEAEAWLAETGRPGDLLFGYEPLFLGAWERNGDFPRTVLPRADANLALRTLLRHARPLGRGVWVFDASERNNLEPALEIDPRSPTPEAAFTVARFGPFLVVRTREPVVTPDRYLLLAGRAELLGRSLGIGDADVNLLTVERADRALRGYGASLRSLSSTSR
jgi:mannosyltransferase